MKVILNFTFTGKIQSLDVEPDCSVEQLKAIALSFVEGMDVELSLLYNNKIIDNFDNIKNAGVNEGGTLFILGKQIVKPQPSASMMQSSLNQSNVSQQYQAPANSDDLLVQLKIIALRSELMKDIERYKVLNPHLAEAVLNNNQKVLKEVLNKREAEMKEYQRIMMDPDNPENQKKIQNMIKQTNIRENYMNAYENNPEIFISVPMLYVECAINGVNIQAFVDSGAQNTIMSRSLAKKCNLLHLVDESYRGIARGVGTGVILGRIHSADIHIGGKVIPTSFTVMDDKCGVNFLFGLDNLRKHRCSIDLAQNKLTLLSGQVSVPFLDESKVVKDSSIKISEEEEQKLYESALKREESKDESPFDEEAIAILMSHGYDRENCIKALLYTGGNAKMALSHLKGNI